MNEPIKASSAVCNKACLDGRRNILEDAFYELILISQMQTKTDILKGETQ